MILELCLYCNAMHDMCFKFLFLLFSEKKKKWAIYFLDLVFKTTFRFHGKPNVFLESSVIAQLRDRMLIQSQSN